VSAARPKVADYPFTTLVPQLGVVARGARQEDADPFVIADLPGLIAGAARGAGLGAQFLRHVERCRVLVHLVDLSSAEDDAAVDLDTVEKELGAFNPELLARPRLLVGSKLDAARPERRESLAAAAAARALPYRELSAVTGEGVADLVNDLFRRLGPAA
jgi:GTP-binding protein